MAGRVRNGGKPRAPEVVKLRQVRGYIVFDLPGAEASSGGTRLAPDVTVAEVALLARAMTYKFAALGTQVGGAKAGLLGDPADLAGRAARMARYCAEILPLAEAGRFHTGPDMGTSEKDFAPLREHQAAPGAMSAVVRDLPFEDLLTGYGVVVAAEAALRARTGDGWDGRSAAIEGFGKVGGGAAREIINRGGKVVAISTLAGSIADPAGLDVEGLLRLRRRYGDECIAHCGRPVGAPDELFAAVADVVVPGARPGAINGAVARKLAPRVLVIAPAANVPYTRAGAKVLRQRSIAALADFVCNAGAVIGYRSPADATPYQVLAAVEDKISEIMQPVLACAGGPLAGACERAAGFLRTWWGEPPAPPFAG
jgi:glutamate dehydrogenase (NAD(P)+)